jgi:hypothetical protein
MSLGAGSVAFANVVKSAEPFVSVLMGVLMGMGMPSALECASLVPIIAGVLCVRIFVSAYICLKKKQKK